jgi:hypothetical protein
MNRSATRISLATLAALTLTATASAHHSYAEYDRCEFATVEGEIARLEWGNPHVILSLRTAEATYLVEWQTVDQLRRANVEDGALKIGDRIVITGSKNRTPGLNKITLLSSVSRPSDGWSWSRPRNQVCKTADEPKAGQ